MKTLLFKQRYTISEKSATYNITIKGGRIKIPFLKYFSKREAIFQKKKKKKLERGLGYLQNRHCSKSIQALTTHCRLGVKRYGPFRCSLIRTIHISVVT